MFARGLFAGIVGVVVAFGAWAFVAGPDALYRLFYTTYSMPNSCKVATGSGKMECRVKVEVKTAGCPQTATDIKIDPDPLKLDGDKKTILVWQFTGTNKFYFCPSAATASGSSRAPIPRTSSPRTSPPTTGTAAIPTRRRIATSTTVGATRTTAIPTATSSRTSSFSGPTTRPSRHARGIPSSGTVDVPHRTRRPP